MKKLTAVLLALTLLCALCACGKTAQPEIVSEPAATQAPETAEAPSVGLANPVVEYSSLEEINNLTGMRLAKPPVMGVTDLSFAVINGTLAQYKFSVAGVDYTLRGSPDFTADISGYWVGSGTAFPDAPTGEMEYADYGSTKLARWITVDGQYVLSSDNPSDIFEAAAEEIRFATVPADAYGTAEQELIGEYADSYTQRAMLTVEDNGGVGVKLTVHWSSSAFEYNEWVMTGVYDEEWRLSYTDGTESVITTAADGTQSSETVATDMAGYFTLSGGKLLWDGAPEENCRDCAFERMPG